MEQLERCLHWRPKALKGFDMREVKEEARVAINQLKQCLQQSLVRKENMVEDLMRAERDRDQPPRVSSCGRSRRRPRRGRRRRSCAPPRNSCPPRGRRTRRRRASCAPRTRRWRAEAPPRGASEIDRRRLEDDFEAKEVELGNLRRRHEETQESLRATRCDLKEVRESLSRQERETAALRRDRENGESAYGAERKALEAQIRAKMDEVAEERAKTSSARSGFEEKLRAHVGEIEKLTVQNKILNATVAQTNAEASTHALIALGANSRRAKPRSSRGSARWPASARDLRMPSES